MVKAYLYTVSFLILFGVSGGIAISSLHCVCLPILEKSQVDKILFQIRLDMNTFVIAGPSTSTYTLGWEVAGSIALAAGKAYTAVTQCLTDTFSITGSPGGNPPVICGTNSGYHSKCIFN